MGEIGTSGNNTTLLLPFPVEMLEAIEKISALVPGPNGRRDGAGS